jgi:hypothetical protein
MTRPRPSEEDFLDMIRKSGRLSETPEEREARIRRMRPPHRRDDPILVEHCYLTEEDIAILDRIHDERGRREQKRENASGST